jgi:hypothetical protein
MKFRILVFAILLLSLQIGCDGKSDSLIKSIIQNTNAQAEAIEKKNPKEDVEKLREQGVELADALKKMNLSKEERDRLFDSHRYEFDKANERLQAAEDKLSMNLSNERHSKAFIEQLSFGVRQYALMMGQLPPTLQALVVPPQGLPNPDDWVQLLIKIPLDPWGNQFKYRLEGAKFELRSAGVDGEMGTDDDIVSE